MKITKLKAANKPVLNSDNSKRKELENSKKFTEVIQKIVELYYCKTLTNVEIEPLVDKEVENLKETWEGLNSPGIVTSNTIRQDLRDPQWNKL